MPELIQSEVNRERLAAENRGSCWMIQARDTDQREITSLRERLGSPGAAERVAELALSMMS